MDARTTERLPFKEENSPGMSKKKKKSSSSGLIIEVNLILHLDGFLEARKRLADRIRRTHPDRVPIIVERHPKSHNVPETSKRK